MRHLSILSWDLHRAISMDLCGLLHTQPSSWSWDLHRVGSMWIYLHSMDLCGLLYTQPPSLLKMLSFPNMYLRFTYKKSDVHRCVELCVCVQFNPLTNMSVLSKYLSVIITTFCGTVWGLAWLYMPKFFSYSLLF